MPWNAREARGLVLCLVAVELLLVLGYLLTAAVAPDVRWGPFDPLLDVDEDLSVPSWFSSMQLFVVGLVLLLAARSNRSRLPSSFLLLAAAAFLFLSVDEGAGIHEKVTGVMTGVGLTAVLFRGDHGGWITVYGVVVVLTALLVRRRLALLWRDFRRPSTIAMAGAATYFAGAVGVEIVGYQFATGAEGRLDAVRNALEELCEMSGVTLLLYAALLLALSVSSTAAAEPRA